MTITQSIRPKMTHQGSAYECEIEITDVPQGYFPAIIGRTFSEDNSEREIQVDLLPLEQSPGGTMTCNTRRHKRKEQEQFIKVKVSKEGVEMASNVKAYE